MRIHSDSSDVAETKWYEYTVRFVFGGLITGVGTDLTDQRPGVAGIIAEKFGPGAGGLFLAFPAIFPTSALACTISHGHIRA